MLALRVADGIRRHFMYRMPEWALSIMLGGYASILLGPVDVFASNRSYSVMATWAGEPTWGALIGVIAASRLGALILNGTFPVFARYSPLARSIGAALGALVWFALAAGFFEGAPHGTGWWNYTVLLLVDVTLAVHIAGEAGAAWKMPHGRAGV